MNPKGFLTIIVILSDIALLFIAAHSHQAAWPGLGQILEEVATTFQWPLFFLTMGIFVFSVKRLRVKPQEEIDAANTVFSIPVIIYGVLHIPDLFK